jgi:NTE family protein
LRWWHLARPVWPVRGFVNFDRLARYLVHCLGDLDFSDLAVPFTAVATDIQNSRPVALNTGRLATAVQASCSVPGFVTPVELDGRLLADGCLSDTVPVSVLHRMGAEYVIGVDIFSPLLRRKWGPIGMGLAAIEILVERAGGGIDQADCMIVPNLAGKTYLRFSKREEFFRIGQEAASLQIPRIRADLGL